MAIEREIRFLVTEGTPPRRGREMVQGYLLRGRLSARVRLIDGHEAWLALKLPGREGRREWVRRVPAWLALKLPGREGRREWERRVPAWLARWLLNLRLPRVEKLRAVDGDLEIDQYTWPPGLVVVECELSEGAGPPLRDREACSAWMEARRPAWVKAWRDVTPDPSMTAARLARRRS